MSWNEEQSEMPTQFIRLNEKLEGFLNGIKNEQVDSHEAQYGFKIYQQLKKYQERKQEILT